MAAQCVLLTIFLLGLCWYCACTSSVNVTSVFQWDVMDFNWPSEEKRSKAVHHKSYKPESISPRYAAVFANRLFLSLSKENGGNPVSLAWLPTKSTASEPPKLNPFPNWQMHEGPNRSGTIMRATGLEVDRLGRLWVLDVSYQNSKSKIWIFNLKENDAIHLVHQFGDIFGLNDLVLDETQDDWLAYITYYLSDSLIAFSLKTNRSWLVESQGQRFVAIAISPKNELLYLSNHGSKELYSIGLVGLRSGSRAANPELIGNWTAAPCRMVVDKYGGLLASFFYANFTTIWNTTHNQPFREQRFFEVEATYTYWPITLALDTFGTLWMTVQSKNSNMPRYRLLKAAVGAKFDVPREPKIKKNPSACLHLGEPSCSFTNGSDEFREKHKNKSSINVLPVILICLAGIIIVSIAILVVYFFLRLNKRRNPADLPMPRLHEPQQMNEIPLNAPRPPSPGLYETPKSRSSADKMRKFKPFPTVAEIMDRLGPPPPIPTTEYDDVGPLEPQPENLYVQAGPSRSSNYLRILPNVDRPPDLSY
ncbi:Hypothetical predicted protein [Cloeon dipterum]|uniref:Bee-milk protein n=1 Tax=Cloeon dipterum TaxID=197152 RepID=A0A8S1DG26_9INSE|nr:Hypothetical predicted protein [Cloeon dipterum]